MDSNLLVGDDISAGNFTFFFHGVEMEASGASYPRAFNSERIHNASSVIILPGPAPAR